MCDGGVCALLLAATMVSCALWFGCVLAYFDGGGSGRNDLYCGRFFSRWLSLLGYCWVCYALCFDVFFSAFLLLVERTALLVVFFVSVVFYFCSAAYSGGRWCGR